MDTTGIYDRNRIYLLPEEQEKIKVCKIVLAGVGIGSTIAECALRLGFENICLIDGDKVEISNLNRQNYTAADIGKPKVTALMQRLKQVNPNAQITYLNTMLDEYNIKSVIKDFDIAVNALDFNSIAPFLFDEVCISQGIPVLHPYNLGWAGCAFIVNEESEKINFIQDNYHGFEIKFANYLIEQLTKQNRDVAWLRNALDQFMREGGEFPPPQLSSGSWITAGLCASIMFNLIKGESIKLFPNFYFLSAH